LRSSKLPPNIENNSLAPLFNKLALATSPVLVLVIIHDGAAARQHDKLNDYCHFYSALC
jgi:hypothetical protein